MMIYIHIPFCLSKCNYCDFASFANKKTLYSEYVDSLINEIENHITDKEITSIFIGGGTPTVLPSILLKKILNTVNKFNLSKNCEFTIEANPETINIEMLEVLKNYNVNRLSMGLQTTDNTLLKSIGRIHTYEKFLTSYSLATKYFSNINLDLMFALPNQTYKEYVDSLEKVIKLNPAHISSYSLIIEENTQFYNAYKNGELNLPNEELDREMYEETINILSKNGYNRYEISNYSKSDYECKHNIGYWTGKEYVGFGLSSASYKSGIRYNNTFDIDNYIKNKGLNVKENINILTENQKIEEYCFLGLRMVKGIDTIDFKEKFNKSIFDIYNNKLENLIENNLIIVDEKIRLTNKGIDLSNYVFEKFLL